MPRLGDAAVVQALCRDCEHVPRELLAARFSSLKLMIMLVGAFEGYKRWLLRRCALMT
jgi:hypothetical protein